VDRLLGTDLWHNFRRVGEGRSGAKSLWRRFALVAALLAALPAWISFAKSEPSAAATSGPVSIVQLGDSIASGEGTLYGFSFQISTGKWKGPTNDNPTWEGKYQDCHQSKAAYGQLLAKDYPSATFTQLACTGATFEKGIAGPWSTTVPAEFGNWATRTDLNPDYSAARPDLVLVTLGADDVQFEDIVTQCAEYVYYHPFSPTQCTTQTPNGPDDVIKKDFFDYLPTLETHLTTLVQWIRERSTSLGSTGPPTRVIFTTYPDPLPSNLPPGGKDACPDTWLLYNDQVNYLSSLVHVMDDHIVATIDGYAKAHDDKNLAVVDLSNVDDGHQWCAKGNGNYIAPFAYGFSIYAHYTDLINPNPAAFHPTLEGQAAIAARVEPVVHRLFA
jgi:lysophospholipase L1-like esterase